MTRFASAREAKEFLVARIAEEAQREGIPLSDVERKMLYFTETGWTLPDIAQVGDQFDREYNREEYEKKITRLIRNARKRARKEDKQEFNSWSAAVRRLSKEDHYLLAMIEAAGTSVRPRSYLKLRIVAFLLICFSAPRVLAYIASKFGQELTRESVAFFSWAIAATVVFIYVLLRVVLGRDRTEEVFDKITGLFLGRP